ncbi:WSC domain-containing protein 1 [Armadillidium vulgare]|nr:WSC domain-containing protein 1 [Armadillidium vulgare]
MEELNNQGIIIIRNPFMALVSHRHLDAGGHIGFAPEAHFEGEGWRSFVLLKIKLWKEFYMDWINNSKRGDLCVIFYEDLTSDVLNTLKKVLNFLSLPVDNRRLQCIAKYPRADLKRKKVKIPKSDPFTQELQSKIYEAIDELNQTLVTKLNIYMPLSQYKNTLNQY